MNVFISGSITIKSLDADDITYLEQIIDKNHTVLIGDAYGADKAVQQYFAKQIDRAIYCRSILLSLQQ